MTFEWKDWILGVIAVYGALLSTFNTVKANRKDQRTVRVTCVTKIPVGQYGPFEDVLAHIQATNLGQRPVTITQIGLRIDGGGNLSSIAPSAALGIEDTVMPATLADGQTAHLHFGYLDIASALMNAGYNDRARLIPFCQDSAGGVHRGEVWNVGLNDLVGSED